MLANRLFWLIFGLSAPSLPAAAQTAAAVPTPALNADSQRRRFAVAHDSLMRLAADTRTDAESRIAIFKAQQGTFGGLHRRIRSSAVINGPLIKKQVIKNRFGRELERVKYYDYKRRLVLSEWYEGRQLTRLELRQYESGLALSVPLTTWLLVRGDYLHVVSRAAVLGQPAGPRVLGTSYYFGPRPRPE